MDMDIIWIRPLFYFFLSLSNSETIKITKVISDVDRSIANFSTQNLQIWDDDFHELSGKFSRKRGNLHPWRAKLFCDIQNFQLSNIHTAHIYHTAPFHTLTATLLFFNMVKVHPLGRRVERGTWRTGGGGGGRPEATAKANSRVGFSSKGGR